MLDQYLYENPEKKKIIETILGIIIGIIILVILIIVTTPMRADFSRKKDILNFLNRKSSHNISSETKTIYKNLSNLELDNKWDISDVIADYLNKMFRVVAFTKAKANWETSCRVEPLFIDNQENITKGFLDTECGPLSKNITNEDIQYYNNKQFETVLSEKLGKLFIHESKNSNRGWFINSETAKKNGKSIGENQWEIALPYNCYASFTQSTSKPTNYKFTDAKWKRLDEKSNRYELELTAIDENGNEEKLKTWFTFDHDKNWLHKRDMTINIYDILYKYKGADFNIYSPDQQESQNNSTQKVIDTEIDKSGVVWEKIENY